MKIPIAKIYVDNDFNCRGAINAIDVIDLSNSIKANGLIQAITVRPKRPEEKLPDHDWVLVAGYRRTMACIMLGFTEIEASVMENLDPIQAAIINLAENLSRSELNVVQQARSLKLLQDKGLIQKEIAEKIGKSQTWVSLRLRILDLPKEVQDEAAAGKLSDAHLQKISTVRDPNKQIELTKKIKEAIEKGNKKSNIVVETKPGQYQGNIERQRKRGEITDLLFMLMDGFGESLTTKALAWAAGNITNKVLWEAIVDEGRKYNKIINIPTDWSIPHSNK